MKECEKKDKYLDLARELKKLWNLKVTIVPIVIGAFGTITKGLLKGPENCKRRNAVYQANISPKECKFNINTCIGISSLNRKF